MADAWTRIPKPTGRPWVKVSAGGKELYDDPVILFDDLIVFFDGGDGNSWIKVPKPVT